MLAPGDGRPEDVSGNEAVRPLQVLGAGAANNSEAIGIWDRQFRKHHLVERTAVMRWFQLLRLAVAAGLLLGLGHVVMHAVVKPGENEAAEPAVQEVAKRALSEGAEPVDPQAVESVGQEKAALEEEKANPPSRLYAFIYQRGPVQHAILGVAAFALVLLYWRQRYYLYNAAQLKRFDRKAGNPPGPLAEALRTIGRSSAEYGAAAARAQIERFHDERSKATQQDYDIVRFSLGSLPVLGLLGTMLGLSDALYEAFSHGYRPESVQHFVAGLSTALDTTVLAMLCAAPLFAWVALLMRQESRLVEQYTEFLRRHFGLSDIPEGDKGAYAIYAELCRLTKQIGQDAKTMFTEIMETSATALRETLGEAVQKHLAEHHQAQLDAVHAADREMVKQVNEAAHAILQAIGKQNHELVERVAEAARQSSGAVAENTRAVRENLGRPVEEAVKAIRDLLARLGEQLPQTVSRAMTESLAQAAQLADQRHTSLADRMSHHMGRLESAIRNRTPEEVIIRYRENGKLRQGA